MGASSGTKDGRAVHNICASLASVEKGETETLPPVDGGSRAWLALAGCFVLEAVVWGFPQSYGIFQPYYLDLEPFSSNPAGIAAISTTAIAIMFISAPLVAVLVQRFPHIRLSASMLGLAVMVAGLLGGSYCNSVGVLLATQGVLYGIGGLFLYFPAMYLIDEWFVARKGFAYGVVLTGTGLSGAIIPFLLQWLLDKYGFRAALRVWAVVLTVLSLPAVFIMKNRFPVATPSKVPRMEYGFMKSKPFWIYQIGNIGQSLAYFLPPLWIPAFAREMGMPSIAGPVALCLLNLAVCAGYLLLGRLVDRVHVNTALLLTTLISMLSVFIFWGLATSQVMLYVFAIMWGLSGGSYAATWTGCANAMRSSFPKLDTGFVISLMCAGKGVGSVIVGPISEQLLRVPVWQDAKFAFGSQYGTVIVFTGIAASLGGLACVARLCKVV